MPDYFLVHDRSTFDDQLRPALGEAWRRRTFAPCLPLALHWKTVALDYASRYHLRPDDLLLPSLLDGLPFDRLFWRTIVGELLLVTAIDIPPFPGHLEAIPHLLAPHVVPLLHERARLPPILQVLHGRRDLTFGLATYRPEHAGLNHVEDVCFLARFLTSVRVEDWTPADLADLPDLPADEQAEELAFARDWFASLADLYHRVARAEQIVILESIY